MQDKAKETKKKTKEEKSSVPQGYSPLHFHYYLVSYIYINWMVYPLL